MTNPYYNHTSGAPAALSLGSSSAIRAEYDLVAAGFTLVETAMDLKAPLANPTFTTDLLVNSTMRVGRGPGASSSNTALGIDALASYASGGGGCTAIGHMALEALETGAGNTAVGDDALLSNVTADSNTAVGRDALRAMTTGENTAVGAFAMSAANGGNSNTAVGRASLQNATGSNNTAVGRNSGIGASFSGSNNTIIGYSIGNGLTTGTQNTLVGCLQSTALSTGSNNTVIGYSAQASATGVNNEITLGNASIATLRCQVTSITSLSDARDKTAVRDLPHGLDFVNSLRPVEFTWNTRDGAKVGVRDAGFIAQELQAAQDAAGAAEALRLVYAENPEKLEASYGHLIPVLVKAIQDLSAKVEALQK